METFPQQFEDQVQPYLKTIERLIRFKIPVKEDAEDLFQETLITAFRHMDDVKKPESLKPWLLKIARSKCSDYFRRKARSLEISLDALEEELPAGGLYRHEERLAVRDSLEKLGDKEKQILYLYYFKDLPQEEIARRLGVPLGTVKSRLYNAKKKFEKEIQK